MGATVRAREEASPLLLPLSFPLTTSESETGMPADSHSTDHGSETVARTLPPLAEKTCTESGATPLTCRTAEKLLGFPPPPC